MEKQGEVVPDTNNGREKRFNQERRLKVREWLDQETKQKNQVWKEQVLEAKDQLEQMRKDTVDLMRSYREQEDLHATETLRTIHGKMAAAFAALTDLERHILALE